MLLAIIVANIVDHEACHLRLIVRPDFYIILMFKEFFWLLDP